MQPRLLKEADEDEREVDMPIEELIVHFKERQSACPPVRSILSTVTTPAIVNERCRRGSRGPKCALKNPPRRTPKLNGADGRVWK